MGKHKRVVGCIPIIRNPKLLTLIRSNDECNVIDASISQEELFIKLSDWEEISVDLSEDSEIQNNKKNKANKNAPLLLMVTARSDPSKLIFPKGGLHKDEDAMVGALRETWEEAGVSGICTDVIVEPNEYSKDTKFWCYEMNISKIHKIWPESHQRRRVWLDTTNLDHSAIEKLSTKKFTKKVLKIWFEKNQFN